MATPTLNDTCCGVDLLERALNHEAMTRHYVEDPLEASLIDYHMTDSQSGEREYARLLDASTAYMRRQSPQEVLSMEEGASKEKKKSALQVEVKPLPSHLTYEFRDSDHMFPISTKPNGLQLVKLLDVLSKHRGVIGYNIDDIKGLSPSLYMHHIFLDEGHRASQQPQCCLNPNMQKIVKKEVVKFLDTGIIYPISDSEWVNTVHIVPKKGGIVIIENEHDNLISTRTITEWCMCLDHRKLNQATH